LALALSLLLRKRAPGTNWFELLPPKILNDAFLAI